MERRGCGSSNITAAPVLMPPPASLATLVQIVACTRVAPPASASICVLVSCKKYKKKTLGILHKIIELPYCINSRIPKIN